jgi:formylglycine-generating enzyme required for sulfatase activity
MRFALRGRMLALVCTLASSGVAAPRRPAAPAGMSLVGPGVYKPLYAASPAEQTLVVKAFLLDRRPVTNAEFLAFVRSSPSWRRDQVKRLFADEGYLARWKTADALGEAVRPASPVTQVSWFAAKAFCAARGARLPNEREWELAALASESAADGSNDPRWLARILAFYSQPTTASSLRDVGRGKPNFWGIYDMHGLSWEWVYDFGASLVAADSREKGDAEPNRFCGASGADSRNPSDYAAFMRVAFRSSLQASFTTARLGFRCAADVKVAS